MSSRSQLLLFVFGLFLSVASADVDCSKRPKFMDPRSCCSLPEFISPEMKEKCKEYNIAMPKLTVMSLEPIHLSPCFISCVFTSSGIYKDNKVDNTKLKTYLQDVFKNKSDLQKLASDAFADCAAKIEEFKTMKNDHPSMCSMTTTYFMGCVNMKMLKECPAAMWSNNQDCNHAREYFQNCKPMH